MPDAMRTNRRMRILCLTKRLSLVGGAERSQSGVVRALSARGHEICVLHEPDEPDSRAEWGRNARLVEAPALHMSGRRPRETLAGLALTATTARAFKPDVVYTYLHYQLSAGLLAARVSGASFVHHARVPAPAISGRRRFWWPLTRADRVIFVSRFTAEEYFAAGFDRQRGVTIHNGIDMAAFAPLPLLDRQALRRRFGFSDTDTVLVFAGRSSPDKGLSMLAKVLRTLRADPGIRCLILTDGDLSSTPEGRVLEAELTGLGALVLGWQRDVGAHLAASDLALVPSQWPEPFGRSVVEPMSCGVPVIATRVGGIPEILTGGLDRLMVDPWDVSGMVGRVRQLGTWRSRSPSLGRALRTHVAERFSLDETARRIEGVLMSLGEHRSEGDL